MSRLLSFLGYLAMAAASSPIAALPLGPAKSAGGILGTLAYHLWGSRRKIAEDNINRAITEGTLRIDRPVRDVIRENFRLMGVSLAEVIKLYYGTGDDALSTVRFEGIDNYINAKAKGKGVILITAHTGNWELMADAFAQQLGEISVVARRQNNPYLNTAIERVRKRYGNNVIYKKGAIREILSLLKKGGTVGILMDQAVIQEEGVVIDFLGMPAWALKAPALIARKTSSPLIPLFISREGSGHVVTVGGEAEVTGADEKEDTAILSRHIEDQIRRRPEEWLWIHRRWKRT